ncbi:putative EMP1-like protein, partial [Plasmodium gaboni]
DDNTHQFLRWLTEWTQQFCKEKITRSEIIKEKCEAIINGKDTPDNIYLIKEEQCKKLFMDYEKWFISLNNQWKGLSKKYNNIKKNKTSSSNTPNEECALFYVTNKCNECNCNLKDIEDISKRATVNDNTVLKELVKIIELDTDTSRTQIQNISKNTNLNPKSIKTAIDTTKEIVSYGLIGTMGVTELGLRTADFVAKKIQDLYNEIIKPVDKKADTSSDNLTFYENTN